MHAVMAAWEGKATQPVRIGSGSRKNPRGESITGLLKLGFLVLVSVCFLHGWSTSANAAVCGNGILESGEDCDLGGGPNGNGPDSCCTSTCTFKTPTIVGVGVPNKLVTIVGTEGDDVIDATHGSFWVKPKGGNDCVFLDGGNDRVDSSPGNDTILDTGGVNNLNGGEGDDLIIFDSSHNHSSEVSGGKGNDNITDECTSNCGNDLLRGGEGDDFIHGGAGNNFMTGDGGDDFIIVPFLSSGNNCIDGGPGFDFCVGNVFGTNCCVNCEATFLCDGFVPSDPACKAIKCK